jgi:hypothetical protein
MENNWIKIAEGKPKNLQEIQFKLKTDVLNSTYSNLVKNGLYIESEDMFFVGFEDESDEFYFSWSIEHWRPLELNN